MRPKTLILFFVAIGCGLVASIGVSQYMEKARSSGGAQIESLKVYVASTEINIGEKLDDKNIKLEEWPKDRVPEGAIAELKDLENKYPRMRLYKGEPILAAKLSDTVDGDKSQTIPPGFRVVAVKVNAESAAGNLIRPGDRVDLVIFLRKSNEVPATTTRTILRDVTIFACDTETERTVDKGTGQSREVRTMSLLVKPNQAEMVTLAKELGIMSLTLRRPDDVNDESSEGETVDSLLGSDGDSGQETKKPDASLETGLSKWLTQAASEVAAAPVQLPTPAPVVVPEEPAKFIMKIRTPNGDREYRWKDLEGEPEETAASAAAAAALPSAVTQPVSFPVDARNAPNSPVKARAIQIREGVPPRTNSSLPDANNAKNSHHSSDRVSDDGGITEKKAN